MLNQKTSASEEQIRYADILSIGMWIGLAVLVVTFMLYVFNVLPHFVPVEEMPLHWGKKASVYIHELGAPIGWDWISYLGHGDYLNFIGIAILAGLTVVCYGVLIRAYAAKKDRAYLTIAILEVAVLLLAASGLLKMGGH